MVQNCDAYTELFCSTIKGSIVSSRKGKIIWIPESKNRLCVSLPIPKIDFEWIYISK